MSNLKREVFCFFRQDTFFHSPDELRLYEGGAFFNGLGGASLQCIKMSV